MNSLDLRIFSLPGIGLVGIATAKAIGSVPRRNRQKRRVREAFWLDPGEKHNLDWVIVVKASAVDRTFGELAFQLGGLIVETQQRWADDSESG